MPSETSEIRVPRFERLGFRSRSEWDAAVVLTTALLLLVAAWHWSRPGAFRGTWLERTVADILGDGVADYRGTFPYVFWGMASSLFRIVIPLGVIVFVLRARPADFGYRFRGIARHLPVYGLALAVMVPLLVWASSLESFQATYPFYDRAVEGGLQFWVFELGYWLQFVALEAFFRGYLVFGLRPQFGTWPAVLIMTVPYVMIHFGKPLLEVFAAIGAGIVLGHLALRSRSWVPGALLHMAVAFTMDVAAISREAGSLGAALRAIF